MFLYFPKQISISKTHFFLSPDAFNLDQSKILSFDRVQRYRMLSNLFSFKPFPNKPWFLCLKNKYFENTAGKGEIAHQEQFHLSSQCFLPCKRTFCHHQIQNCCLQTLSVWRSLKFVVWERFNPLPDNKILDWSKLKVCRRQF